MNCRYSESDVALYVEGDLAGANEREFQAHLAGCAPCRQLEAELRESQSVFKTLRQDTVSAAALAHVRARVLAEAGGRSVKPGWERWVYAVSGVAFVVAIIMGVGAYLPKPDVKHVVASDPPARASQAPVPLTRGTMGTIPITAATAPRSIEPEKRTAHVASVPLPEGDRRAQSARQEVAQAEIHNPPTPVEPPAEPPRQIVVKLLTDDPNIVIYWLLDQKTGGTL